MITNTKQIPASVAPGVNNHVTIEIHGDGQGNGHWQPVEFFADSTGRSVSE